MVKYALAYKVKPDFILVFNAFHLSKYRCIIPFFNRLIRYTINNQDLTIKNTTAFFQDKSNLIIMLKGFLKNNFQFLNLFYTINQNQF